MLPVSTFLIWKGKRQRGRKEVGGREGVDGESKGAPQCPSTLAWVANQKAWPTVVVASQGTVSLFCLPFSFSAPDSHYQTPKAH